MGPHPMYYPELVVNTRDLHRLGTLLEKALVTMAEQGHTATMLYGEAKAWVRAIEQYHQALIECGGQKHRLRHVLTPKIEEPIKLRLEHDDDR